MPPATSRPATSPGPAQPRRIRNPYVIGLAALSLVQFLTIGLLIGRITNNPPATPAAVSSRHPAETPASKDPAASQSPGTVTATSPLSPTTGEVIFSSNFAKNDGWQVGAVAAHATGKLSAAGYVMSGTGNYLHNLAAPMGGFPAISVSETSAIPPSLEGVGPECLGPQDQKPDVFQLDVHSDGQWWLEARLSAAAWDGDPVFLGTGDVGALTSPPSIEIVCATLSLSGTTARMRVAGFVDGHSIVDTTTTAHNLPYASWSGGIFFGTNRSSSITFTRFVARQLDT